MKKLLAMVLALVMTLSLAVSANAFTDDSKVNDSYAEAVAVLNGMGVFKGYEDGSFKPEGDITRAEVATIVYRIYTADVAKNDKSSLYATYNKFSDMAGASWAAGYIGYCANAELVKGYPDGTFKPSGKVTGYEVLAMILRAVGYDKNGEFTGADWALHVAQTAQQAGLLKNVKGVDLNAAASRELVAELLFRGIQASTVTYTPAFGYVTDKVIGAASSTIGVKNFKLDSKDTADKWGRPGTLWTYNTGDKKTTVIDKPDVSYTKAVAECDVAHDAGLTEDTAYTLYVNGDKLATKYTVNLTDTKTKMGAQGRLFEVYDDTIVMIDTYLAKVTYVAAATYDAQNHLKNPATITLEVYDGSASSLTKTVTKTPYTMTNGETNYEYVVGDYVLLNAFTNATNSATASGTIIANNTKKYGDIVGKATSVDGAQSVIYWNAQQHNVEGTVYDDAAKFYLDEAKQDDGKYTWFFDQYGNLIGDVEIAAATNYGVITKLWWAGNAADGSGVAKADVTYMDGTTGQIDISEMIYNGAETGVAYTANYGVVTHSSTTATNKLMQAQNSLFYVDPYATENARDTVDKNGIINDHLFQFTTKSNGTVKAMEVGGNGNAIEVKDGAKTVASVGARMFNSLKVAVSKNTQIYGTGAQKMIVNDNTLFLVRTATATAGVYTYSSVKGFTNIGSYTADNELDYVDLNKDGVADYVYITSPSATSKVTSLFYYDGAQGAYPLADGVWALKGYVDGEAGEIKFEDYAALTSTLRAAYGSTNKVAPTANTLYVVALEDGYVMDGHIATEGGVVSGYPNYPLSTAYDKYVAGSLKVAYVEGNAGTKENSYNDRDTFDGSLYTDTGATIDANVYYSVIANDNTTKIVGTMGVPAYQNYYFVYVYQNGENNRLAVQAYAFDKSSTVTNDVITGLNITDLSVVAGAAPASTTTVQKVYINGDVTTIDPSNVTASVSWEKGDANDKYQPWSGDYFTSGSYYRATITLTAEAGYQLPGGTTVSVMHTDGTFTNYTVATLVLTFHI